MKLFIKVLIPTLLCALACGCKQEVDPLQEALGAYILQGQEGSFRLTRIEKIDSTTFRTEFERRQNVFERKLSQETKLFDSYVAQRKPKNAERHRAAIVRTREVMASLDSLKATMEGRLDEIAYYDYVFTGRAETKTTITELSNAYVSITPEFEVITLSNDRKDLHKAGGRAIPGYLEMLGKDSEEVEEE
ncbi:MAG: hypothetical protein J5495_05740 [Bacteroidales bacterium]|nr:hypothetical protein [Bacteroidales bacterium]